jgi:RHS repeat-associated protein
MTHRRSFAVLVALGVIASAVTFTPKARGQGYETYCNNPVTPVPTPQPTPPPCCEPKECDKCTKSPNYVGSGMYETRSKDIVIRTVGFPLEAARHYLSSLMIDGPLGIGWTSSLTSRLFYAVYLYQAPSTYQKEADIIMPDGARYSFRDLGNGSFEAPRGRFDVLVKNGDGTFDLTLQRSRSKMRFDSVGLLTAFVDDYGNTLNVTYDVQRRVQRIADAAGSGRYLDVTWGANGRIATVRDHTGRQIEYTYNGQGTLRTVKNPLNQETAYSYVTGRFGPLLSRITDPWGRVVTDVTWDTADRVLSYTEAGETHTYSYNYQGNPALTAKTSSGNTWVYTTNSDGVVTGTSPPGGGSGGSSTFDVNGLPLLVTDSVGVQTLHSYNAQGNPLSVTNDYGGPTAVRFDYTYDADFPEKVTAVLPKNPANGQPDVAWQGWQYEYWPPGSTAPGALRHVRRLTDGLVPSLVASYEYNTRGQVTRQTSATGGMTDYEYDAAGNVFRVTAPSNNDAGARPVTVYASDSLGRVTGVTEPGGHATAYVYDGLDRPTSVTLPKPSVGSPLVFTTGFQHDNFDAVSALLFVETTDLNGQTGRQGYDQHGRLVRSVDVMGRQTSYGYAGGELGSITDANGNVTSYGYDSRKRLSSTSWPDGAVEDYTYWDDGQLKTRTDRRDQVLTYTYDRHKRLQVLQPPSGSITYTYQGQKLTQVVDTTVSPAETHLLGYDNLYRVNSETQGSRGTVTRAYLPDDSVQSMAVQGGPTATYSYYPDGSLNTIAWTPVAGVFKYEHTIRGQVDRITVPSGQRREYSYDDQGRLLQLSNKAGGGTNLATYAYGYDLNHGTGAWNRLGQRVSLTATVPSQGLNGHQTKYEYDGLYQLTKTTYPNVAPLNGEVHSWTYDGIGNRVTSTVEGVTQTYGYQKIGTNPNNWQRLLTDGVNTYTYDANGNTATRSGPGGNVTFVSDPRDRLAGITGAVTATYRYDYQGRRSGKTVGAATSYLYDGLDLVRETTGSSTEYLFGPGIDQPLAMLSGGQVYYYCVDGLVSVNLVTNAAGVVQNTYLYDSWGVLRQQTGPLTSPFSYTARETGEAGVWFYRARYYQPTLGRFVSEDPLGPSTSVNQFTYVLNSPVQLTDALGLWAKGFRYPWWPDWLPDQDYFECRSQARQTYDRGRRRCEDDHQRCVEEECEPKCKFFEPQPVLTQICIARCFLSAGACNLGNEGYYRASQGACELVRPRRGLRRM